MTDLTGQAALITGGSGGISRETAQALAGIVNLTSSGMNLRNFRSLSSFRTLHSCAIRLDARGEIVTTAAAES
jgi:short-subunit dehydrogenase involved in D-alanine esterification of teichoic acids